MPHLISDLLSFSTVASNIVFFVWVALFLFSKPFRTWMSAHISRYVLEYTFLLSLAAMLGSLALSNIIGFAPCELCWLQRVFMYPQVIVSFVAWIRKEKGSIYGLLPLSIIGWCISLYQSYIQWGGENSLLPCTLDGGACGKLYIYAYHYVTIPFMALSMFTYLIVVALVYIYGKKQ